MGAPRAHEDPQISRRSLMYNSGQAPAANGVRNGVTSDNGDHRQHNATVCLPGDDAERMLTLQVRGRVGVCA